ncbi:proline-tRNA ligase [Pneumocystis murina B123]|uniref:proline--tRNA ligase n=1 Tax=Pneumocystis murina (strain B123) TaxID=1069680 RepID=M7NVH1_PNEMU|nr:proline-tRNA ligase [Pneumocystis murina B123]EMR11272.1 proline-tRNA ligase [Pneumocystis murina B123]
MNEKGILHGLSCLSINDRYIINHEEAPSEVLWKKNLKKQTIFDKYLLTRIRLSKTGIDEDKEFKLVFIVGLEDSKIEFSSIASVLKCKSLHMVPSELVFDFFGVKSEQVSLFCLRKENISKIHLVLDSRILVKEELLAFRLSSNKTVFITSDQLLKYLVDLDVKRTDIDLSLKQKANFQSKVSLSNKDGLQEGTLIGITVKKKDNFSEWYRQVLIKGEWFDSEIKKMGVEGCYFPMFVSSKVLEKEKDHIEGFAPEVAWITKAGNSNLEEPIAIRPTSETIMYSYYSKWIRSHRDLPLKLNQWNSVVRWEFKHPQPFLRTREFLWQEGHTVYLNRKESEKEVFEILDLYEKVYIDLLAVPVIKGIKSEKEKFAGAAFTATIEGYIPASGRAIQAATSHSLGQNFSKMFDICVENPDTKVTGEKSKIYVWQNSWGLSTRAIGIMIMTHGDDKGLVIPPKVSKIQVIVIPCGITVKTTNDEQKLIQDGVENIVQELKKAGIRVNSDSRTLYSPGWKFSHWEMMGVPLRLEYGLKDHKASQVIAVRRDTGIKFAVPLSTLLQTVSELLTTIQSDLYKKAKKMYDENIQIVYKWDDFVPSLNKKKVLLVPWCKISSCEEKIRQRSSNESNIELDEEETLLSMGAKSLCIPLEQPSGEYLLKGITRCVACENFATTFALFGRSY